MSSVTQSVAFKDLNLTLGQRVGLIPDTSATDVELNCTLVGFLQEQSVILAEKDTGDFTGLKRGQKVILKFNLAAGVALFSTQVQRVVDEPVKLVLLEYPKQVKFRRLRSASRVAVNVDVMVNNLSDRNYTTIAAKLVDISTGGACIHCVETLGEPGQSIELKGKFELNNMHRVLTIPALIRSVAQKQGVTSYGIQFEQSDEDSLWVLFGFIFHAMVFGSIKATD